MESTRVELDNVLLELVLSRILVLCRHGLGDIWMRNDIINADENKQHAANILGYDFDDWNLIMKHSGLFKANNAVQSADWWENLFGYQLKVKMYDYKPRGAKGDLTVCTKWFRCSIPVVDTGRSSRSSAPAPTPATTAATSADTS
jgi:hypothetical protein